MGLNIRMEKRIFEIAIWGISLLKLYGVYRYSNLFLNAYINHHVHA